MFNYLKKKKKLVLFFDFIIHNKIKIDKTISLLVEWYSLFSFIFVINIF